MLKPYESLSESQKEDATEIPMTDTEYEQLKEVLDSYVDENGVVFGFVGWLLND